MGTSTRAGARSFVVALFLLVSLCTSVVGQFIGLSSAYASTAPATIGYQGYIQQSGTPLTGTESFTFALYNAASGGAPIWSETQSAVPVAGGYFSVSLGSQTPLPSSVDFSQSYYLQVTINGTALAPRQSIDAVPYAHVTYGVVPTATAPSSPSSGAMYFDPTGSGTLYVYDASSGWTALATSTNSSGAPTIVNLATGVSGTLPAASGGTGLSGSSGFGILVADGNGGWTQAATSSLGLFTTDVAEGSNLYFTNARADARVALGLSLATALPSLQTLPALTLTGTINVNGNSITGVPTPVNATDAANKSYVDTFVQGLAWQAPVISVGSTTPPVSPNTGDRYVLGTGATGAWIGEDRTIATWTGSAWSFATPAKGYTLFANNVAAQYNYNGTSWVPIGAGTNFSALSGFAAVNQGGTGTTAGPLYGQLLLGNSSGGYSLVATSSLGLTSPWIANGSGIYYNGGVGIGTTNPAVGSLALSGGITANGNILTSPAGSSTLSPRVFGFSPTYGTGQAAQFQFGSTGNVIQNAYYDRMQIESYWGLEIRGNQESLSPQFVPGYASDAALSIYGSTGNSTNIVNINNTGGTTLDVVTAGGSLGIGTTTPGALLAVGGNALIGGNLAATGSLVLNGALTDTSAATSTFAGGTNITSGCYAVNGVCISGAGVSQFTTSASNTYLASGNLGIDNANPQYPLDVTGAVNASSYFQNGQLLAYAGSSGNLSIGLGANGGVATSTFFNLNNTAIGNGSLAGLSNTGNSNTAVGYKAINSGAGITYDTAVGFEALYNGGSSFGDNDAFGYQSQYTSTGGYQNASFGAQSLKFNTSGYDNAAFGFDALVYNTYPFNSVAIGASAGQGTASYTNNGGVYVGFDAGEDAQNNSNFNTFIGYAAGSTVTTGSNNIVIGAATSSTGNITTGSQNILIGDSAALPSSSGNGQLNIGNFIYGTGLTGTGSTVSGGSIGIGTTTPGATFAVNGNALVAGSLSLSSALTDTGTATSTFGGGTNITSGCYAVNGVCLTSGGTTPWMASGSSIFYNTGAVGIGTTTPFASLSIAGIAGTNAFAISTSSNTATALRVSASGNLHLANGAGIDVGNGVTPPANGIITAGTVGIGTTTPGALLAVGGNALIGGNLAATGSLVLNGALTDTSAATSTFAGGTNITSGCYAVNGVCLTSGTGGGTTPWTTSGSNIYYNTGNVGIGTSNPIGLLDIGGYGTPGFSGNATAFIAANQNSIAGLEMKNTSTGTSNDFRFAIFDTTGNYTAFAEPGVNNSLSNLFGQPRATTAFIFNSGGTSRNLALGTIGSNDVIIGTSNTDRLHITAGGNVGVGTTTPGALFAVAGNTLLSGNAYVSGGLGIGTTNASAGSLALSGGISAQGNIITSPSGSSTASPRVFGFSPTYGVGQAAQFEFGSTGNVIQNAYQDRMQIESYWGLEIRGNQQTTSPQFDSSSASDPAVSIYGATGNGSDILDLNNNGGTTLDVVSASGNLGIGTTTPGSLLAVGSTNGINFTIATSTFNSTGGINLAKGCYAMSGNCLNLSQWTTSGAGLYFNGGGDVAIGTTTIGDSNDLTLYTAADSNDIFHVRSGNDFLYEGAYSSSGQYVTLGGYNYAIGALPMELEPAGGNVGIGTQPASGYKLDINGGGANAHLRLLSGSTSGFSEFDIGRTGNDASIDVADGNGNFSSDAVAGDLILRDDANGHILFNTNSGGGGSSLDISGTHVSVDTASNDGSDLEVYSSSDTQDNFHVRDGNTWIYEGAASSNPYAVIGAYATSGAAPLELQSAGGFVGLYTNTDYDNDRLAVNATAGYTNGIGIAIPSGDSALEIFNNSGSGSYNGIVFSKSGNISGSLGGITVSQTSIAYGTGSDARIKQNIATTTDSLADLMGIQVADFEFKSDPSQQVTGFIAQNLENIFPDAVTTNGDNGLVPLGASSTPWTVDYGRVTPLIVKAVQDIANISSTFEANLVAWFGNAQNGIHDFYTNTSHQKTLCVGDASNGGETCITKSQLDRLLQNAATPEAAAPTASNTLAPASADPSDAANSTNSMSTDSSAATTSTATVSTDTDSTDTAATTAPTTDSSTDPTPAPSPDASTSAATDANASSGAASGDTSASPAPSN